MEAASVARVLYAEQQDEQLVAALRSDIFDTLLVCLGEATQQQQQQQ